MKKVCSKIFLDGRYIPQDKVIMCHRRLQRKTTENKYLKAKETIYAETNYTQPNTINQASNHFNTLTVTPVILCLKSLITTWLLSRGCTFKMPSIESSIAIDFQWLVNVKVYVTSTSPVTWSLSRSNVWFQVGLGNVGAVEGEEGGMHVSKQHDMPFHS